MCKALYPDSRALVGDNWLVDFPLFLINGDNYCCSFEETEVQSMAEKKEAKGSNNANCYR